MGLRPGETEAGVAREIVAIDAEVARINDGFVPRMGRAANDALRARRGALQMRRVELAARLRAAEVDHLWALRDRFA